MIQLKDIDFDIDDCENLFFPGNEYLIENLSANLIIVKNQIT